MRLMPPLYTPERYYAPHASLIHLRGTMRLMPPLYTVFKVPRGLSSLFNTVFKVPRGLSSLLTSVFKVPRGLF